MLNASQPSVTPAQRRDKRDKTGAEHASGVLGWLIELLSAASGLTVVNLYYAQPLLASLRVISTSTGPPQAC
ncbi:hypothetical protein [Streptomyces roseochromogenus]|uniref:Uncharacterized protein n=1 Tax=Streptomyces roseochromogenus subsp. oscitans DS 12.976 TaxID=1352936 RepID=V6KZB7_STRRC|nr:hypothetical protein [Streptomyces roseochromogenus]EST36786.1 hypothetical protein M878_00655 [Streptomyces roseochromogenus subsp. oscitans DS 12.976]